MFSYLKVVLLEAIPLFVAGALMLLLTWVNPSVLQAGENDPLNPEKHANGYYVILIGLVIGILAVLITAFFSPAEKICGVV